jgi:hypothetical protein
MIHIILSIIVVLPLLVLWLAGRLVWVALATGRLQARGVVYDREAQPVRYYIGIISWGLIFTMCVFASIGVLTHWPA